MLESNHLALNIYVCMSTFRYIVKYICLYEHSCSVCLCVFMYVLVCMCDCVCACILMLIWLCINAYLFQNQSCNSGTNDTHSIFTITLQHTWLLKKKLKWRTPPFTHNVGATYHYAKTMLPWNQLVEEQVGISNSNEPLKPGAGGNGSRHLLANEATKYGSKWLKVITCGGHPFQISRQNSLQPQANAFKGRSAYFTLAYPPWL